VHQDDELPSDHKHVFMDVLGLDAKPTHLEDAQGQLRWREFLGRGITAERTKDEVQFPR